MMPACPPACAQLDSSSIFTVGSEQNCSGWLTAQGDFRGRHPGFVWQQTTLLLQEPLYSKFIFSTSIHGKTVQNRRLLASLHLGFISQKSLLNCVFLTPVGKPVTALWAACHGVLWHGEPWTWCPLAVAMVKSECLVGGCLGFLSHLLIHWS